jgi:hypothetical protein
VSQEGNILEGSCGVLREVSKPQETSRTIKELLYMCSDASEIPIMEELCAGAQGKPDTKLLNITSKSGNVFLNSVSVEHRSGSRLQNLYFLESYCNHSSYSICKQYYRIATLLLYEFRHKTPK